MEGLDPSTLALNQFRSMQATLQMLAALNLTSYLYPEQATVYDGQYFDYIVVGGGTAGCVVATRLAQMDCSKQVLLIEAGDDPPFETTLPKLLLYPLKSHLHWNYTTIDDGYSQQCNIDHVFNLFQGKMLGGTSSLIYLLYAVGNRNDYDKWASIAKDKSWSWDGVFPYFKKSQRIEDFAINTCDRNVFGTSGSITITRDHLCETRQFLQAFRELSYRIRTAINGNDTIGYAPELLFIGQGVRQSTAQAYLAKLKFTNLKVLKNALVTKVIVNRNKIATGVKVLLSDNNFVSLNAKKELIISAGVINTPKLLMLSGIGPKDHLLIKGIPVIADLPVGKNLADPVAVTVVQNLLKLTYDPIPKNPHLLPEPAFTGYVALNRTQVVPDYETLNFINLPFNLLTFCVTAYDYNHDICNNLFSNANASQMLWSLVVNLHPKSRGEVLLRSKDFNDHPIVDPKYYSHPEDLKNHAKYVQDFMKVANTKFFKSVDAKFDDPKLKMCRSLEFGSLEYWECYIKCMMMTLRYFSGTCATGSVVDSRLRVKGVGRLRVADASVIPVTISGDIAAAVIMVGEKMADILKEEYYGNHEEISTF